MFGQLEHIKSIHGDGKEEEKRVMKEKAPVHYNRPYKKFSFPGSKRIQRGWIETSIRMGVKGPVLHLSKKRVTLSDTKPDQHRLQLTTKDVFEHGSRQFQDIADKAQCLKDTGGLNVKIMDRHGNKYHNIKFKYISSSDTFRFNGPSYGEFLVNSNLKENQFLDIWGLPVYKGGGDYDGEIWFAFVNYSQHETTYAD